MKGKLPNCDDLPPCYHLKHYEAPNILFHPSNPEKILMISKGIYGGFEIDIYDDEIETSKRRQEERRKKFNYGNHFGKLNTDLSVCCFCRKSVSSKQQENLKRHIFNCHYEKATYSDMQMALLQTNSTNDNYKYLRAKLLSDIKEWNTVTEVCTTYDKMDYGKWLQNNPQYDMVLGNDGKKRSSEGTGNAILKKIKPSSILSFVTSYYLKDTKKF